MKLANQVLEMFEANDTPKKDVVVDAFRKAGGHTANVELRLGKTGNTYLAMVTDNSGKPARGAKAALTRVGKAMKNDLRERGANVANAMINGPKDKYLLVSVDSADVPSEDTRLV